MCLCVLFLSICLQPIAGQTNLQSRLDALLRQEFLKTSEVGITVYDLTVNKSLYTYQDTKLYRPASVHKLITGITGLSLLGADHRFTTALYHTGTIEGDTLRGDLYVVGGFDSEFDDAGMDSLVALIAGAGIKTVGGHLYGDVCMTDSLHWGAGWSWDDASYAFLPYLSPLLYCKGRVEVTAYPTREDSLAAVYATPHSSFYTLDNQTRCKAPDAGPFCVTRNWLENGNTISVSGHVATMRKAQVNVCTSQEFFMHVLRERLSANGIETPDYAFGECPLDSTATFLGSYHHSLQDVLNPMMKKSDNLSAEAVLYHLAAADTIGRRVSAERGTRVVERFIDSLGFHHKDYRIADGSGTSLYNYVSPQLVLAFLKHAYENKEVYTPLYNSLPIAGIDGTLQFRMKKSKAYNNVRAKTGTVTGVSSLAGYLKRADGHLLAFVIINQNTLEPKKARAFQDRVCGELCR